MNKKLREDIETRLNYALDIPDGIDLIPAVNSIEVLLDIRDLLQNNK